MSMTIRNRNKHLDFDPYTKVPNVVFGMSEISMQARFLYSALVHHCGPRDTVAVSQRYLATECGCSVRYVYKLLQELKRAGLVSWKQQHYNRPSTFVVKRSFLYDDRNNSSEQMRTIVPTHASTPVLPSSNLEKKEVNTVDFKNSEKGMEILRETMAKLGMIQLDEVIKKSDNGEDV